MNFSAKNSNGRFGINGENDSLEAEFPYLEETFAENFLEIVYSNIEDIRAGRDHMEQKENMNKSHRTIPQYYYGDNFTNEKQGNILIGLFETHNI